MQMEEEEHRGPASFFNTGRVKIVRDGICEITGLENAKSGEVIYISLNSDFLESTRFLGNKDKGGFFFLRKKIERASKNDQKYIRALVLNLNSESISAMVLGNDRLVAEGSSVLGTGNLFKLRSSLGLFGHVVNSLGDIIDKQDSGKLVESKNQSEDKTKVKVFVERRDTDINDIVLEDEEFVEKKAKGIIDRIPVRIPLLTGTTAVDSLVPIGRGQRELIIGDRQTGKTTIGIDAILNYKEANNYLGGNRVQLTDSKQKKKLTTLNQLREIVWFVYCGIGQKQSSISSVSEKLKKKSAAWYTAIVSATSSESASLQFLAPYSACTLGEFIRDWVGGHAVVIFDDLTKHAVAYRQMSLLLRRPPGREAFPGDVFYVHSRLLERAGSLSNREFSFKKNSTLPLKKFIQKRGTLTAFPVIETQAGDVSAYIPTNVISITDGQIFLESELFYRGIRPAVNVGLSVSRVGSTAQPVLMKNISGSLKMELAQFREIENFTKLGADLDNHTRRLLMRGENLIEILKQDVHSPLSTFTQSLNLFFGLGLSGKLLTKLNRVREDLKEKIFRSYKKYKAFKISKPIVFNNLLTKASWLEYLRFYSSNFYISDIKIFLRNLMEFNNELGLVNLFRYNSVNTLSNSFISKFPLSFLNDISFAYIIELGSIKIDSEEDSYFKSYEEDMENIIISDTMEADLIIKGVDVDIETITIDSLLLPKEYKNNILQEDSEHSSLNYRIFYNLINGANAIFTGHNDVIYNFVSKNKQSRLSKKNILKIRKTKKLNKPLNKFKGITELLYRINRLLFKRDRFKYDYFSHENLSVFTNKATEVRSFMDLTFSREMEEYDDETDDDEVDFENYAYFIEGVRPVIRRFYKNTRKFAWARSIMDKVETIAEKRMKEANYDYVLAKIIFIFDTAFGRCPVRAAQKFKTVKPYISPAEFSSMIEDLAVGAASQYANIFGLVCARRGIKKIRFFQNKFLKNASKL